MLLSHLFIPLLQTGPVSGTLTQTATASGTVTPTITITDTNLAAQLPPLPSLVIPIYIAMVVLSLLFVIGMPLLVARRLGTPFRYMLWGAAAGFASSVVAPFVAQTVSSVISVPQNPDEFTVLELNLLYAAISAVAAVLGFYLINQLVLKWDDDRTWSAGLMTGVGAAVIVFVLGFLFETVGSLMFFLTRWPLKAADIALLTADQKAKIPDLAKIVANYSGLEPIPFFWTSLISAVMLITAAVMVVAYFRRREWTWLAGGVGLLFLAYGAGSIVLYFLNGVGALSISVAQIAIYTLIAAAGVYFIRRLYEPPEIKTAAPAPATVVDSEAIMPDHSELETPTVSRRKKRR